MDMNIEKKLDLLLEKVENLEQERKFKLEMWDEFSPILKLAMQASSEKLQAFEDQGHLEVLKSLFQMIEEIFQHYSAEDVKQLTKSIVSILDTVKTLTQDDVLMIAQEAAEAIHQADQTKPLGVRGLIKATRDDDVRRGIGMMMQVLRHLGKGMKTIKFTGPRVKSRFQVTPRQQNLNHMISPKRREKKAEIKKPLKVEAPKPSSTSISIEGYEFNTEGFLINPDHWTKELALKIASQVGISELTDKHWALIEYSRSESLNERGTPNMRKICSSLNMSAKEVFRLFPKAPAKTIAQIAGVSKPIGCV